MKSVTGKKACENSSQGGLTRRDLMRFGGAAALGVWGVGSLVACAAPNAGTEQSTFGSKSSTFVSMSEEQRAAAINNPIFMGGETNKNGKQIVVKKMANGGMAPEIWAEVDKEFDPKLIEVVPGKVFCSIGSTNANCTMIIGDTGIIIVDTAESEGTAKMDYDQFKTVPGVADKPIKAVIYTHDHYCNGTTAFLGDDNPNNIPIIAHESLAAEKFGASAMNLPSMGMRAVRQMGMMLPHEGPDAIVGAGMGRFTTNPADKENKFGFLLPNTHIPGDQKYTEMTIDGVRIQFWPLVSDSACSMNLWFPDMKMALTNHIWNSFYNTYPLRGQFYRDPNDTIKGIDVCLSWEPEYHCTCHGLPLIGAEECKREISLFRDSLQFLYDQTLRGMNMGLTPDEIVRMITFPDEILESKCSRPLYGDPEYYIRAVYGGLVGWFDNDAISLHPVTKEFESARLIEAMGGVGPAVEECKAVLEDQQWSWAATLATHIMRVESDNRDAKAIKAEAFRQMGYRSMDSSSRNWYLTEALRLEGILKVPFAGSPASFAGGYASGEKNFFIKVLGINLDPKKAKGVKRSLTFNFTDTGDVETMVIRNCVVQSVRGAIDKPDVVLNMPFALIPAIGAGQSTIKEGIESGAIELVGNPADLDTIMSLFDMAI